MNMEPAPRKDPVSHAEWRTTGMEHRWGRRIRCGASVRVTGAGHDGVGRLRDVSMSGAFVETPASLPVYSSVTITVLRGDGSQAELPGSVARRDADGMGVEWLEASPGAICPVLGCANPCAAALHWED